MTGKLQPAGAQVEVGCWDLWRPVVLGNLEKSIRMRLKTGINGFFFKKSQSVRFGGKECHELFWYLSSYIQKKSIFYLNIVGISILRMYQRLEHWFNFDPPGKGFPWAYEQLPTTHRPLLFMFFTA